MACRSGGRSHGCGVLARPGIGQGSGLAAVRMLGVLRRVLREANRHDVTGRAAEAAFFAALRWSRPYSRSLRYCARASGVRWGCSTARSADLARLLRVVLTARGGVASDSANALLRTPAVACSVGPSSRTRLGARYALDRGWAHCHLGCSCTQPAAGMGSRSAAGLTCSPWPVSSGVASRWARCSATAETWATHGQRRALAIWVWVRGVYRPGHLPFRHPATCAGSPHSVNGAAASPGRRSLSGVGRRDRSAACLLGLAAQFNPTLGSLGGGLIVLAWLYLLTLSLFVGAELNAVLQARSAEGFIV